MRQRGFIALISMLTIGAIVLAVAVGVSVRSLGENERVFGQGESAEARALSDACAETALYKLQSVFNYAGEENIMIGGGSCDILTVSGTGNTNRIVQASSTASGYTRKVSVTVAEISPVMRISTWEEVADF